MELKSKNGLKVGDRVRCIEPTGWSSVLNTSEIYHVSGVWKEGYYIDLKEKPQIPGLNCARFKLCTDYWWTANELWEVAI